MTKSTSEVHAALRASATEALHKCGLELIRSMEFFGTNQRDLEQKQAA